MCYWEKMEFRSLLEYGCYKDCAGLERTAKHAGDYKGLRGILKICGLHVTTGHYHRDCREHGGNEGLQGTMAAYGGAGRLRSTRSTRYIIISAAGRLAEQGSGKLRTPNLTL